MTRQEQIDAAEAECNRETKRITAALWEQAKQENGEVMRRIRAETMEGFKAFEAQSQKLIRERVAQLAAESDAWRMSRMGR